MRPPPVRPAQRRWRRALSGQSIVEYGLTIVLIAIMARGTARAVYQTFANVVTNVRSSLSVEDDLTPTNGPSPTVRLPPPGPTLTALPATATVIAMCPVPNVVGLPYASAVTVWEQYGFASGSLGKTGSWKNGDVVATQSLTQGTFFPCASTSMNVTPGDAPTNTPTTAPTSTPTNTATATVPAAGQTATAVANRTATAVANQTATAAVPTATAAARQTATAAANQTATAVAANQTATAIANQTATAVARQTATAVAQTATAIAMPTATAAAAQTATAAVAQTATAAASLPLVINLTGVPANNGNYDEDSSALVIGATAYDPNIGTANGTGISSVEFVITGVDGWGTQRYSRTYDDDTKSYCAFGGNSSCSAWSSWSSVGRYTYTVTATAYSSNGRPSVSTTVKFTIVK